jgi:phosphodiesterase/alkaline phosphatase D-like protein
VPQSCLDAIASPQRTLLGAAQLAAFTRAIRASTATFKVVVNPEPMLQLYALPYDRWEGYAAERARVLDVLRSVRNVVVLTTDMHAHVIGEIRTDTFAPGGPAGTGIWEVVTGPVATNTYAREIDSFLGAPGFGAVVTGAFFKPDPPRGLGLRCAQTNAYGYAQVTVTRTTLTVQPRTASGAVVIDATGAPCAPLVLRAS